jgi:hypothetical protein
MADKEKTAPANSTENAAPAAAPASAPADSGEGVTAPKRRGRPPKNPPADGVANPVDGSENASNKRGPGRPKKKGKVNFSGEDLNALAKQVVGLHQLAAIATGIPELAISEQEGAMLGGAMASVAEEYNLELSGKTGAMLQLIAVCGMIYVPKFGALKTRVNEAKARRAQKGTLHVIPSAETPAN